MVERVEVCSICSESQKIPPRLPPKDTEASDNWRRLVLHGVTPTGKEIGRGAYGRVFEVEYGNRHCAAKEVHALLLEYAQHDQTALQNITDNFLNECHIWSLLEHPCIVQFMGVYYPAMDKLPVIVMEKMYNSLRGLVEKHTDIPFNDILSILNDVCHGLQYLHSRNPPIVHRDLTPNNILLCYHLRAKITDLGVAKVMQATDTKTLTQAPGTNDFMPPESLANKPVYGLSLDIFSFGGVMLYITTQEWPRPAPWVDFDPNTGGRIVLTELQRRQQYLDKMTGVHTDLKPLVMSCLDDNPKNRPSVANVLLDIKKAKHVYRQQLCSKIWKTEVSHGHQSTSRLQDQQDQVTQQEHNQQQQPKQQEGQQQAQPQQQKLQEEQKHEQEKHNKHHQLDKQQLPQPVLKEGGKHIEKSKKSVFKTDSFSNKPKKLLAVSANDNKPQGVIKDQTSATNPFNDLKKQFVKDSEELQDSQNTVDTLDSKNYHSQIINELEKDYDSHQGQSLAISTAVQASLPAKPHVTQASAVLPAVISDINTVNNPSSSGRTNRVPTVAAGLHNNAVMARSSASVISNTDSSFNHNHYLEPRRTNRGSHGVSRHNQSKSRSAFVVGLHTQYISLPLDHNRQLFTLTVIKGAESGYALTLDLPDSSSLNRSMRGDTVAVDLHNTRNNKGKVVANMSSVSYNHPKEYFICCTDRNTYNLLVPIDKQYPKIDSLQKVEVDGLSIFADCRRNSIACNIKFEDVGKNVYLVRLDLPWTVGHVYPKGVPVKHIKLEGDLTTFLKILKFNYIPSMPFNNGEFLPHILNEAMQQFPRDWEIPVKEKRKRKVYKGVFTIDDEETVVLDDALSLDEDKKNNCYIVNIHIADASYFVKPGSNLDRAASERGRTFYINYEEDGAMFMLPDNICMEHGSLQAGKERLTVTTQFVFSKRNYSLLSPLSDVEVHRSIVRSMCRLTKEDVGKFLLDKSMDKPVNMSTEQFSKMKRDLHILGEIATKLKQSQRPDSYLYEPDRGKQDKYSMAGSSLVQMFMCLCNTAIPAKLLKRDGWVGPVLVHEPIKHYKQHEWLVRHHHLLDCCPVFKRMISDEVITSFNEDHQTAWEDDTIDHTVQDEQVEPVPDKFIKVSKETWDSISRLASKHDSSDLATFLCSLQYFPELYVAHRQLCMSQSKSFYHVIDSASATQSQKYEHSHFGKLYTHFTSPLRRYCDILVHRAVLGRNSSLPSMELIHKINIHKWDEREFSKQRNMLYLVDCCRRETGTIAMTAYVGNITNKVVELHALPELQEILPDRICEMKLSHLQAKCDADNKHMLKWDVEIIPPPSDRSSKKENNSKEDYDLLEIPLHMLGATIEALHKAKFKEAEKKIKTCAIRFSKCRDVEQEVKQSSHKLTITKCIREYSKLEIQLTSSQAKSYAVEPTVSLVHISQTFSCCLLHVKSPIQCYAPNISRFAVRWSPTAHNMSDYVDSWVPAVEAESITNSTTSSRMPLIIKDLRWTSSNKARFSVNSQYAVKYHQPFDYGDYVCIKYHNLLSNPKSQYFELDKRKITWVAHGRIVSGDDDEDVKIEFPDNTVLPKTPLADKLCYLEVIPLQITFRRIKVMFHKLKEVHTFLKNICCRDYKEVVEILMDIDEDDKEFQLNQGQREALETALMNNKLLLVQGPPGTGKSMLCVEMIKRFIDHNYGIKSIDHSGDQKSIDHNDCIDHNDTKTSRGPAVLYCAPSNKAVNVGACIMLKKYHVAGVPHHGIHIVCVYGTIIEEKKFPGLNKIPSLARRRVSFRNDKDFSTVPKILEPYSLHFKIRDVNSKLREVKEFIKYENQLLSERYLRALQKEEDYEKLEIVRKEYTALKKKAELAVLKTAQVIFCTCSEAGSNRIKDSIGRAEQCIIDECGMCTEPETLLPMILSKKIILVGDHKQLQPVVLNKTAESLGLKISMFQRLFEDEKMSRYCIMLTEQYRMHPSICDFPSVQFYDGKLVAAEEVLDRRWNRELPTDIWKQLQTQDQRCVFIHVEGKEDVSGIDAKGSYEESKFNKAEADEVKFVIDKLLQNKIPEKEIMVLTPYRAHKDHIRDLLPEGSKVDVSTIHESQGRECDVVILTTVRSLPEEDIPEHPSHSWVNENLGFVTDEHLMNVAITRAKEALCIIGNQNLLKKHLMWKDLLNFYAEDNCIIQHRENGYNYTNSYLKVYIYT